MNKFSDDLQFGEESEGKIKQHFMALGWEVEETSRTAVLDFKLTKKKNTMYVELKTRRMLSDKYDTTLIGANKVAKAWEIYYKEGAITLFFFKFTDWLYYINPFTTPPAKLEYKQFRWWRWPVDKPHGYCLYDVKHFKQL